MQLHLHPTLHEALTLAIDPETGKGTLTRWSLATTPATKLIQRALSFAKGGFLMRGEITASPDGRFFVLAHGSSGGIFDGPDRLELCRWHDLSSVQAFTLPEETVPGEKAFASLASSPDGRWLVVGQEEPERLFLLDRLSGEIISDHYPDGERISGLTFDPTSTFVAGITSIGDSSAILKVWRLDAAEHFLPLSREKLFFGHAYSDLDHVYGKMALSILHWHLDVPDYCLWPTGIGLAAFSPDSRRVVFCLPVDLHNCFLTAYEVTSGRRLWSTYKEGGDLSPFVFTPDGKALICSNKGSAPKRIAGKNTFISHDSDLLVYRLSDGKAIQRVPSGRRCPIEALAWDHDSMTLWLLTQEELVSYPLPSTIWSSECGRRRWAENEVEEEPITNQEYGDLLRQGGEQWNQWRKDHPEGHLDLSGAYLGGAYLNYADLSHADLSHAYLTHANLSKANLSDADLRHATLSGANLSDADLSDADLSHTNLSHADLSRANLSDADLSEANLTGAILTGANLARACLKGACLRGIHSEGLSAPGADFSDADLRGIPWLLIMELTQQPGIVWKGVVYDGETRYRLIVKDASGRKINGTGSTRDLDGTKRMAVDVLRMDCRAACVEITSVDPTVKFERVVITLDSEEAHEE